MTGAQGEGVDISGSGPPGAHEGLTAPDTTTRVMDDYTQSYYGSLFTDRVTLPQQPRGSYKLTVDPTGAWTGTITVTAWRVPADAHGSLPVNVVPAPPTPPPPTKSLTLITTTPAQNA